MDVGAHVVAGVGGGQPAQIQSWDATIVAQHDGLRKLLTAVEHLLEKADPNLVALKSAVASLVAAATAHVQEEERTLHPLYERYGGEDGVTWLRESKSAHGVIHRALDHLRAYNPGASLHPFKAAFSDLDVALTKSMTFEEAGILPFLKRSIDVEEQGRLSKALWGQGAEGGKARDKEGPNPSVFAPLLERLTPQAKSGGGGHA